MHDTKGVSILMPRECQEPRQGSINPDAKGVSGTTPRECCKKVPREYKIRKYSKIKCCRWERLTK